ncbi:MAG: M1 family aminopeptidase [Thaumarchaeota archaeon]|nr:M1 family aminopeptidase [Candidatus Calditenuaceae archaeon]
MCRLFFFVEMRTYPYARPGRDFAYPEYVSVYPPDRGYSVRHIKLELWIDFDGKRLTGEEEIVIVRNGSGVDNVVLDACELEIRNVLVDGAEAPWHYDGNSLSVNVVGKEAAIKVSYVARPRKGFHFVGPDEANPNRAPHCWSQGETDYNRYWMVLYDHPSVKQTSELIIHVPRGMVAVSNGDLVRHESLDGEEIWHYRMDVPHSGYLISVAAGQLEVIEEHHRGIRLQYFVPKGWREKAHLSFGKTSTIIDFLSQYLNCEYPYRKYAQVVVSEFIFGGMENTTATTLTDLTLHDEKAHEEFSSDPLVAHELVHQWFGDLVTCRDWPHIWLNESFATYLENLFVLHDKGKAEFVYEVLRDLDTYLQEYRDRYARPIVSRVYRYPTELFDGHSYPKGALVLNALRGLLGDEVFRKGLEEFLRRYRYKAVDTEDFRKTMEEVSGRSLELFFEQYLYNSGHPVLSIEEEYDSSTGTLKLRFKQTQGEDSLPEYWIPLRVTAKRKDGYREFRVELRSREEVVALPMPERPEWVCIDPELESFVVLDRKLGDEVWARILREDEHVYCKLLAIRALGKIGSAKSIDALGNVLVDGEVFWGLAAEAAKALGSSRSESAKERLISALKVVSRPKVRLAICEALSNFRGRDVAEALKSVLRNGAEGYYTRQAAAHSLGKSGDESDLEVLIAHLDEPSHNNAITNGCLRGIAEIGGERALEIVMKYTARDKPSHVRASAASLLGRFPGKREVLKRLGELATDESYRVRRGVVAACSELASPQVLPILNRIADSDPYEMVRRDARDAAERVRKSLERGTEYRVLREELEKIREENRRLIDRMAALSKVVELKG